MEFLGTEVESPLRFLEPVSIGDSPTTRVGASETIQQEEQDLGSWSERVGRLSTALLDDAVRRSLAETVRFPRSARAFTNLGQALLNSDQVEEAVAAFQAASELAPDNPRAMSGVGQGLLKLGQLEEARSWFERVIELRPSDSSALMGLASVELSLGNNQAYADLLESLIEYRPEAVTPRYYLGVALTEMGRPDEAIAVLREATRIDPHFASAHLALGQAFHKQGNLSRALHEFRVALTVMPDFIRAKHAMVQVLAEKGEFDEALSLLDDILSWTDEDLEALELRAWVHFKSRNFKKARRDLHKIVGAIAHTSLVGTDTHARILSNLGTCYWSLGNWDDAEVQFSHAIKHAPTNPVPYHNFGRLLIASDQPDRAVSVLQSCLRRFPSDTTSRRLLIRSLDRLNQVDRAIDELQRWVESDEAPGSAWAMLGYFLTARRREPDVAAMLLERAYKRFPDDSLLANNLAYALLMQGNAKRAREVLEGLCSNRPRRELFDSLPVLHATWGLLRLHEGDRIGALRGYEAAEHEALRDGDTVLAASLRRKRHLEFARMDLTEGNLSAARDEIRLGLAVSGEDSPRFRDELLELDAATRASNPDFYSGGDKHVSS